MTREEVPSTGSTTPQKRTALPVRYTCTYQGFQGTLTADASGCAFTSDLLKAEFAWANVKWIRVTTKYVKDTPTSVLAIKMARGKGPSSGFNNSGKHYFYHLMDIVEASRELQALKDAALTPNKASGTECPVASAGPNESMNSLGICDSGKTMPPAASNSSSLVNSNRVNQAPPASANTAPKLDNSLQTGAKSSGVPCATSPAASRQDDDLVSSSSTGRARKAANTRDDGEEENNGRGGAGAGVNMPFIIGVPRHAEQKENASTTPQTQRSGGLSIVNRRRRGRQREADAALWSRCCDYIIGDFAERPLHAVITLVVVFVGIISLLLALRLLLGLVAGDRWHEPLPEETVARVTRGLEQLKQWRTELYGSGMGKSAHRGATSATIMLMNMRSTPPVRVTLKDVTAAIKELLARYVAVQQKMIATRLQRLRREHVDAESVIGGRHRLHSGVLLDSLLGDEENEEGMHDDDDVLQENAVLFPEERHLQPTPRFSTARIKADLKRMMRYVRDVVAMVRWVFSRRSTSGDHHSRVTSPVWRWRLSKNGGGESSVSANAGGRQQLTRYTEALANGQLVTQEVTPEDWYERRKCLRLTRELLHLSSLIEEILVKYQDVVMGPLYETYLHQIFPNLAGMNKMYSSVGAAVTETTIGGEHEENGLLSGQNGHILRSVLLRRQTLALLYFDPLLPPGISQKRELLRRPQKYRVFSNVESNSSKNGNRSSSMTTPTKEDVEAILEDFMARTSMSFNRYDSMYMENFGAVMRNILGEMKYWYEHEEEWQTVVLWRLNSSTKRQNANQAPPRTRKEKEKSNDDLRKALRSLPLFRGLWCFLKRPVQFTRENGSRGEDNAASSSDSVPSHDSQNTDEVPADVEGQGGDVEKKEEPTDTVVAGDDEGKAMAEEPSAVKGNGTIVESTNAQPRAAGLVGADTAGNPSAGDEASMEEETESAEEEIEENEDMGMRAVELVSQEAQIRWLNAFDLFIRSHEDLREEWSESSQEWDWEKSHEKGMDEGNEENNMAYFRQRFIRLIGWAKHHYGKYLSSDASTFLGTSGTLLEFMRQCSVPQRRSWWMLLWPPSWFFGGSSMRPMSCWILRLTAVDPALRHVYNDMLQVPLGDLEDLPLMLLYTLSTPSELLKAQYHIHAFFSALTWLLLFVIAATIAMVVFPTGM